MRNLYLIIFLIVNIELSAQYLGGDSQTHTYSLLTNNSCPSLFPFYIFHGGNSSAISESTLQNSDCQTLNQVQIYKGGVSNLFSFSLLEVEPCEASNLPIDLVEFSGNLVDNKVNLKWVTASEFNVANFEVLHSLDNIGYQVVGSVPSSGNSTVLKAYKLTHETPSNGINYYVLKNNDLDGASSSSNPISIYVSLQSQITITSHNGMINIFNNNNVSPITRIEILDIMGKEIVKHSSFIQSGNAFVVNKNLEAGIYLIRVNMLYNNSLMIKILIN